MTSNESIDGNYPKEEEENVSSSFLEGWSTFSLFKMLVNFFHLLRGCSPFIPF